MALFTSHATDQHIDGIVNKDVFLSNIEIDSDLGRTPLTLTFKGRSGFVHHD